MCVNTDRERKPAPRNNTQNTQENIILRQG